MSNRTARLPRAVASLAMLGLLVIGVPALLLELSRRAFGGSSPLTGVRPPWEWSTTSVADTASAPIDDHVVLDVVVRSALVLAWVALVVVVATTVGEIVHLIRHRGMPRPSVRGLGWAQRVGRFVAAGLLALGPIAGSRVMAVPRLAVAMPAPIATTSIPTDAAADDRVRFDAGTDDEQAAPADRRAVGREHVVVRGESVYSIAADLCGGDPARTVEIADAILDANLGAEMGDGGRFTNPAYIETGWRLRIPPRVGTA